MYKIAIIGAGQLGSRHLQGLAKISIPVEIEVVDTSLESLKTAEERFLQVPENCNVNSIRFFNTIDELSNVLDLVIVATNAKFRFEIISELVSRKDVKNLVLEKVVFQSSSIFMKAILLIEDKGINCWVNCTRRLFPFYKSLKDSIKEGEVISLNVQGGNWGLACNSIHFLDLFSYICNSTDLSMNADYIDSEIYESKRDGYIELSGLLVSKIGRNKLTLYSGESQGDSIITISTDSKLMIIDESNNEYRISEKNDNWEWKYAKEKIVYFQSEITNVLAEDILLNNTCSLTTLRESYEIHKPFLDSICSHINKVNKSNIKICPIT